MNLKGMHLSLFFFCWRRGFFIAIVGELKKASPPYIHIGEIWQLCNII